MTTALTTKHLVMSIALLAGLFGAVVGQANEIDCSAVADEINSITG